MESLRKTLACYLLMILSMVTLVACQIGSTKQSDNPALFRGAMGEGSMKDLVQVKLVVEPRQFSMSERQSFKISIVATNQGDQVIDPELHRAQLFVNDTKSMVWSLAISNGRRETKWYALPPGDTVSMSWSSMGPSLFPDPGEYTLILRLDNQESAPIQVHVLAN